MAYLQFSHPVAERDFMDSLGRSSANRSLALRVLNCAAWASAWRYARRMPWRLSLSIWQAGMILIELAGFHFLLNEKRYHRHERIKAVLFIAVATGFMVANVLIDLPINQSLFPPLLHALYLSLQQVRLCTSIKLYGCNAVVFAVLETHACYQLQYMRVWWRVLGEVVGFAAAGLTLPILVNWLAELHARRAYVREQSCSLSPRQIGPYWSKYVLT